jgi:hypothetical protein
LAQKKVLRHLQQLAEDGLSAGDGSSAGDALYAATWDAFYNDTRVVATLILMSGALQGFFSQAATHLLTVAGSRSMTSLQGPTL